MRLVKILAAAAAATTLAACASAPSGQYYTLLPDAASSAAPGREPGRASFAISVQPVEIPAQVDRPQLVLSQAGSAQVTLLNESLWAAPLADEVRNALSSDLTRRLGALDIARQSAPSGVPLWSVSMTVRRFESIYGRQAVLDATWRLAPSNLAGARSMVCAGQAMVEVGPGMPALVQGHQQALQRLAGVIAAQLRGVAPEPAPGVVLKGCAGA